MNEDVDMDFVAENVERWKQIENMDFAAKIEKICAGETEIPECQCDGPGHCPVYNIQMTEKSYHRCKHDAAWRKDSINFYNEVNSPEFQERAKQLPAFKEAQRWEKELKEEQEVRMQEEREARKAGQEAYLKVRKQQEQSRLEKLTPEQQEEYHKNKAAHLAQRKHMKNSQKQLDEVVSKIEEEGVNLENYEEKKEGLGDLINGVLSKLGITEETVTKWSGLDKGGCGCDKKQQFLNKVLPFRKKE